MKDLEKQNAANRLDRTCQSALAARADDAPWTEAEQRGALDLGREGTQHRRYHSLFEDLLN